MMGSNGQTIVNYGGTALPLNGVAVDLFNSAVAFPSVQTPSGGSFHLLGLQWFQWSLRFVNAAGTGIVTGAYSVDKGLTWRDFYSRTAVPSGVAVASEDEVYVGMYKDIRFQFTSSADTSVFEAQMALNPHKATSKSTPATDVLASTGAYV